MGTRLAIQIRPNLLNAKNIPRCTCTRITTCPSFSFRVIRCIVKGYHLCRFEVNVGEVWLLLARRGENAETRLKLFTNIVDSSATYSPGLWVLYGHYMQMPTRIVIAVQNRLQNRAGKHLHILFLLDTIGAFIDFLVCMYVIFVLSTNNFVIIGLGIAALFIILKQLMLLLLAISLFANVELLVTRIFL